jgi:hypothetical protein
LSQTSCPNTYLVYFISLIPSVFVKNYSSKNLNISLWKVGENEIKMKGEGGLVNVELDPDVIQEFMPPMFQVDKVYVNSLKFKYPSLTSFGTEPIKIFLDTVICKSC